jgi:aryl-alcohol dehydrogenase-like predicted oxidoreductase
MDTRRLGGAGLVSSAMGLGTAAFMGTSGPVTAADCRRTIHVALDTGVTLIDAGSAPDGAAEALLGQALAGRRAEALIATRVRELAYRPGPGPTDLGVACEESLRRLRTDHIDLLYLPRSPRIGVEEGVGQLGELARAGKIRHVGLCAPSADELRRAQAVYPVSAVAVEYSLRRRAAEDMLAVAAELGVGVVACRPLGGGLLAGRNRAGTSARDKTALRAIEAEAAWLNLGMARLALAWLLAQRPDIVPVPGTRDPTHAEMNASAVNIRLPAAACARLDRRLSQADQQ